MHMYVQVEEVRLRLNVDATVPPDSQPAPAPIESFADMVKISGYCQCVLLPHFSSFGGKVLTFALCRICMKAS